MSYGLKVKSSDEAYRLVKFCENNDIEYREWTNREFDFKGVLNELKPLKYIGGFPDFEGELYTFIKEHPNGNDWDVKGIITGKIYTKSRIDFERIQC